MTNNPYDRPRVYINWERARPAGWRGWVAMIAILALSVAALALIAIVASTLFVIALIVGAGAAATWFIGNLFRGGRKGRNVGPYRGNTDA
jgi:hypothetical protein